MSFTRAQYEETFALMIRQFHNSDANSYIQRQSVKVMWMIEDVIGQQSDFPIAARDRYPREIFKDLPRIRSGENERR